MRSTPLAFWCVLPFIPGSLRLNQPSLPAELVSALSIRGGAECRLRRTLVAIHQSPPRSSLRERGCGGRKLAQPRRDRVPKLLHEISPRIRSGAERYLVG